ncbi:MAG TPA: hypothetical protein PLL36_14105 [Candidatus Hydrogenedentes bacterium]|mgnify:FL=1|nr:hypothetical protein [Candidatus Hydrogenedentota bacterium]
MKRFLMRAVRVLVAALLTLVGVMLYRTMTFTSMQIQVAERPLPEVDMERAVDNTPSAAPWMIKGASFLSFPNSIWERNLS